MSQLGTDSPGGKSIPIIKESVVEVTSKIEQQAGKSGPKPDTKRMAVVGAIYSIDRSIPSHARRYFKGIISHPKRQ